MRSSIELVLLIDVAGRDGGPLPAPDASAAKLGGTRVLPGSAGESVLCGVAAPDGGPEGGRAVTEGIDVEAIERFDTEVGP